jgi:hypothetical protein
MANGLKRSRPYANASLERSKECADQRRKQESGDGNRTLMTSLEGFECSGAKQRERRSDHVSACLSVTVNPLGSLSYRARNGHALERGCWPLAGSRAVAIMSLDLGREAEGHHDCQPGRGAQMRCLGCGAESAEVAQVCARCGAPITPQGSVGADPAEGGSGDPIAPPAGDGPHQPAGQRPEPSARRNALVLACLGLVVLVAVTVLVWSVTTIIARLSSSASPRSSASASPRSSASASPRSSASASSPLQTAYIDLRAGDCLQGPGLNLWEYPWPDYFNVVSCTKKHIAEVFFAGNAWPSALAFPGDNKIESQADTRCNTAFRAYDGIDNSQSAFTYESDSPNDFSWLNGDRGLLCIAYEATQQYLGGAPVNYSIKGSQR